MFMGMQELISPGQYRQRRREPLDERSIFIFSRIFILLTSFHHSEDLSAGWLLVIKNLMSKGQNIQRLTEEKDKFEQSQINRVKAQVRVLSI